MNEQANFFSELIKRLVSADPAHLVVVGTIAFGYIIHFCSEKFPKRYVPLATAGFTLLVYPIVAFKDGQTFRKLIMDVVIAMVLWVLAWAIHKFALLPLRAKLKRKLAQDHEDDADDQLPKK